MSNFSTYFSRFIYIQISFVLALILTCGSSGLLLDSAQAQGSITGLDFPSNPDPSNSQSGPFVAMQFINPQNHGLPIWGPGGQGATYIWKIYIRPQTGYYVTMWWSNNGDFLWNGGGSNSYYGGHPYPRESGNQLSQTNHYWEVATEEGGDFLETMTGAKHEVVKNAWYTQALQVTKNPSNGRKSVRFYINLPSTAPRDIIHVDLPSGYGETNPPKPALTFGDAPWWQDFQHERLSGVLRHIKIFNKTLSEADIIQEAAADNLVTSAGNANVWYMNINPTPNDITDKSGKGHHFVWANSNNKAGLWTGSGTPQVTAPAISPNGGSFEGAVEVSLSTDTSGATIYYTTDGSTPTTSSAVYGGPFTISSTVVVKALGVASNLDDSAVSSASFTITSRDLSPPENLRTVE